MVNGAVYYHNLDPYIYQHVLLAASDKMQSLKTDFSWINGAQGCKYIWLGKSSNSLYLWPYKLPIFSRMKSSWAMSNGFYRWNVQSITKTATPGL